MQERLQQQHSIADGVYIRQNAKLQRSSCEDNGSAVVGRQRSSTTTSTTTTATRSGLTPAAASLKRRQFHILQHCRGQDGVRAADAATGYGEEREIRVPQGGKLQTSKDSSTGKEGRRERGLAASAPAVQAKEETKLLREAAIAGGTEPYNGGKGAPAFVRVKLDQTGADIQPQRREATRDKRLIRYSGLLPQPVP